MFIDERALSKLRWRCRRGLLENDLFIDRFFKSHAQGVTTSQARGLELLMDLSDNDLLDLFLLRQQPAPGSAVDSVEVHALLGQMRNAPLPLPA
jgi:antitoxin CptB